MSTKKVDFWQICQLKSRLLVAMSTKQQISVMSNKKSGLLVDMSTKKKQTLGRYAY